MKTNQEKMLAFIGLNNAVADFNKACNDIRTLLITMLHEVKNKTILIPKELLETSGFISAFNGKNYRIVGLKLNDKNKLIVLGIDNHSTNENEKVTELHYLTEFGRESLVDIAITLFDTVLIEQRDEYYDN